MSTIYLVNGWSGVYDSKTDWTVRAELSREAAERHIALCLQQLEQKFNNLDPQFAVDFTIPADPQVCICPCFGGSLPTKIPGGVPSEWFDHGVRYEVVPVELNDEATSALVIHRCGKSNV